MSRRPDDLDDDDDIARITRRMSARGLSIHDVAEVIGSQLKKQRREIIQDVHRRLKMVDSHAPREEARFQNLHRRVTLLEADIRTLTRKGFLR